MSKSQDYSPTDIAMMSLTEMTDVRKGSDVRNLIYHYNTSRNSESEPCVYVYDHGNIMHPDKGFKFAVHFEKRGETDDTTPPVVRFNSITEVRTFIIALLALRGFKPAQGYPLTHTNDQ